MGIEAVALVLRAVVVLLVCVKLAAFVRRARQLARQAWVARRIPGPGWESGIGNLRGVEANGDAFARSMYHLGTEFRDRRGLSVAKAWLGTKLFVFALDYTSSAEILKSAEVTRKSHDYRLIARLMGQGLVTAWGEHWQRNRKLVNTLFGAKQLADYTYILEEHVERFVHGLRAKADGREHNLFRDVYSFGFGVIHHIGMGEAVEAEKGGEERAYFKAFGQFFRCTFYQGMFPLTHHWPFEQLLGLDRMVQNSIRTVREYMAKTTLKKRAERAATKSLLAEFERRHSFLDQLLDIQTSGRLTEHEMDEELLTLLFAGHDTTALTIVWTLWALATHPEAQERLHAELIEAFPTRPDRLPLQELNRLPYLNACIKESMRVTPPVPRVQRACDQDFQLGGHLVPAGANLVILPYVVHRDPRVFPEPDRFIPERFLEPDEEQQEGQEDDKADENCNRTLKREENGDRTISESTDGFSSSTQALRMSKQSAETNPVAYTAARLPPYAYFPFSAGLRNCAGQKLAMVELRVALAQLCLNFRFHSARAHTDNKLLFSIASAPSLGLPVRLEAR